MDTKRISPPNLNQMSGLGLPTPGTTPLLVFEAIPQETTVQELFNKIKGKEETHYSECYVVQMTKSQKLLFERIQKEFIGKFACISVKRTSSVITGLTIKNCFKTSQSKLPYKVFLEINNLCSYNVGSARNNIVTGLTSYENFIAIFGNCPRFFPKKNQKSDTIESKLEHETSSTYIHNSDKKSTNTPTHIVSQFDQPPPDLGQHPPSYRQQPPPSFEQRRLPSEFGQQTPPGFEQRRLPSEFGQHPPPGFEQRRPPHNIGQQLPSGFVQPPSFGQQPPPGFGQVIYSYNQQPSPIFGQVSSGYSQQQSGFGQSVSSVMPYVQQIEDDDTNLLNMAASSARNRILDQNI